VGASAPTAINVASPLIASWATTVTPSLVRSSAPCCFFRFLASWAVPYHPRSFLLLQETTDPHIRPLHRESHHRWDPPYHRPCTPIGLPLPHCVKWVRRALWELVGLFLLCIGRWLVDAGCASVAAWVRWLCGDRARLLPPWSQWRPSGPFWASPHYFGLCCKRARGLDSAHEALNPFLIFQIILNKFK
jgi:hypothetical protein